MLCASQHSLAERSYVWPSVANTGSCLSSRVMGHLNHSGAAAESSTPLATDDCDASEGGAYGECANLDDRMASPWWARHAQSFAARQRDAYERSGSLGWAFGAWKYDEATEIAMHPAVLAQRSLRAASQAGWLPDLETKPALPPCLRAPAADFALGDATAPPRGTQTHRLSTGDSGESEPT